MSKLNAVLACSFTLVSLSQVPLISFSAEPVVDTIAEVVNAREQAAGYVLDVKSRYQAEDPHYIEAKRRYLKARASYTAWIIAVKNAIRQGETKNLDTDSSYRTIATHASQAANDFAEYVDNISGESKGIQLLLATLVELGLKIWDGFKDITAKERERQADAFEKDVGWQIWEHIQAERPDDSIQSRERLRIE